MFYNVTTYQDAPVEPLVRAFIKIVSATVNGVEQDNDYRLVVPKNGTTEMVLRLETSDGSLIPLTDSFAVPIGVLNGPVADTILLNFEDGVCTFTDTWETSGEFVITEDLINIYLNPEETKFVFKGLAVSVYR